MMKLYSPDITKPMEVNYYWHEKVLVEPMPKPKQGEWVEHLHFNYEESPSGSHWTCSVCNYDIWDSDFVEDFNYCPNCGARMKKADKR